MPKQLNTKQDLTIRDIAYDVDKRRGYTVYINENDDYVPYFVLTDNYGGNVLLLRKFLLDETIIYNDYYSYYPESFIDTYLNESFLPQIGDEVQKAIIDTEIVITAESSLGVCGQEVEEINRKVFLLSYTELGLYGSTQACVEGTRLQFFTDDLQRRIAYRGNAACSWWLRTSYNWGICSAYRIGPEGATGGGGVYYDNGIRPAFCLPPNTPISEEDLKGERVYIITNV